MITRDRTPRRYCSPVGTHHLAVDLEHDGAFRAGLLRARFVLTGSWPPGVIPHATFGAGPRHRTVPVY